MESWPREYGNQNYLQCFATKFQQWYQATLQTTNLKIHALTSEKPNILRAQQVMANIFTQAKRVKVLRKPLLKIIDHDCFLTPRWIRPSIFAISRQPSWVNALFHLRGLSVFPTCKSKSTEKHDSKSAREVDGKFYKKKKKKEKKIQRRKISLHHYAHWSLY